MIALFRNTTHWRIAYYQALGLPLDASAFIDGLQMNWKAEPLVSYRVIVDLIAATTTKTALTVHCELDSAHYPKGILVSDRAMEDLNITRDPFHGEWNYTIHPVETNAPPVKAVIFG